MEAQNIEPLRVVIRCRPLSHKETQDQKEPIVKMNESLGEISITNPNGLDSEDPKTFSFDHIYGPETSQSTFYNEIAFPLVDSVLRGYNGTIFAYGQTGAGKTHTIQGTVSSEESKGILARAIEQIFSYIENTPEKKFLVQISFIEIYNEQIHDLLNRDQKTPLLIREKSGLGIYVQDLLSLPVENAADAIKKLIFGNQTRTIQQTRMSMTSSRSHAIFSITVESSETGLDGKTHIKRGKLNLVDLAGSERQQRTGVTGTMLREGNLINQSLRALLNIISALGDPGARHIPYRDSKLTRILQDSLGGNAKTVMIANIGPADWNYDETISTLRVASRAKSVMNKPMVNEEFKDIQEEIEESKTQLNEFHGEVKEGNGEEKKVIEVQNDVVDAKKQRFERNKEIRKWIMSNKFGGET